MIGEIVLYAPHNADRVRLDKLNEIIHELSYEMGIRYRGPIYRDDKRICIYYEDKAVKVYIYVDDPTREVNFEKVKMTIKLMALMALKETMIRQIKIKE